MKRKFAITVSAMMLAAQLGSPLAAEEPSLEQLTEISALLAGNDVQALRAYLSLRPELLEGNTPLNALLREFMADSEDLAEYLGFEPDLRDEVTRATRETVPPAVPDPVIVPAPPAVPETVEPEGPPGAPAAPPPVIPGGPAAPDEGEEVVPDETEIPGGAPDFGEAPDGGGGAIY